MTVVGFGTRLAAAIAARGPLCVGIDPHARLLTDWGLPDTATGAREFGLRTVEAATGRVAIVKPQVAFFERFGAAGFAALEDVLAAARAAGILVLADAKRGDIGSTMDGYTAAWLAPGAPLEVDAITVSPYLGPESLREPLTAAIAWGKGAFVLAATSNPDASLLQAARTSDAWTMDGETVALRVVREAALLNGASDGDEGEGVLGSIGVVIGATVDRRSVGIPDAALGVAPVLAPGFGAQGVRLADGPAVFGALTGRVIPTVSRSVLAAGPDGIAAAVDAANREVAAWPR